MLRERAAARKAVVSHEAEADEAAIQIASLNEIYQEVREHLEEVERNFAGGRIFAPIAGIVSTNIAHRGQSLGAGTPIAEILDQSDVFVDWYIPNERLRDPKVGNDVLVLFGNRRISGTIVEILPVSDVYASATATRARAHRHADRTGSLRPGNGTTAAEFDGLCSHALHRPRLPRRRRAGQSLRASVSVGPGSRAERDIDAD